MHPRTAGTPPRFVFAATINTHLPFAPVPPYQDDWQRVLGEQPFEEADIVRALAEPVDWLEMRPAYLRAVEYRYRWLGGWLRQGQPRETVYVLLGDHQPTANVSGEGASWDVPMHIAIVPARERGAAPSPAPLSLPGIGSTASSAARQLVGT